MTVLTKPSLNAMKPDEIKSPLVLDVEEDAPLDVVYPTPVWTPPKRSTGALLFMSIVAVLVAVTGVSCGLMLYRQYLRSTNHRYQAYCNVPYIAAREELSLPSQLIDPNMNELMPLRWYPNPDVQIIGVGEQDVAKVMNTLREEFDIRGRVERIRVYDNGRQVSFIHDFDGNVSGIVDQDRCFLMDLDQSLVLAPETLMLGIERDEPFDVSRVQSTLRATLPALARRAAAIAECLNKPTYRLEKVDGVIRKRSAEAPSHDYVQFAGQKVQEIHIANLDDLLKYERYEGDNTHE